MTFTIHNGLSQIETGLVTTIADTLGKCVTVADLPALRGIPSAGVPHGQRAFCTAAGYRYGFDRFSTAADNGTTVIKPGDNPAAGRWLRSTSTSASGYLRSVQLYDGDSSPEGILTRLNGVKPGVVIVYGGDEFTKPSTIAGALYQNNYEFDVWCVSSNLRPEFRAALPSAIASEAAADPGVNQITGDVAYALAGSQLGLADAVRWVEIISRRRESTSLADRLMVYALRIKVYASVHLAEEDGATVDLGSLSVQREFAPDLDAFGDPDILALT